MVKPRKITLIVILLMLVGGHVVSAQDPLTQQFVSADGTLRFSYPADWVVQDTLGSVTLSNSPQAFDETTNTVIPGTLFAVFFVQRLEDALPPQVERTLYSAMEYSLQQAETDENAPDFGDVVTLPIGGHPSYHSRGISDTQDALILVLDLGGGYFGELSVVTAPGELESFQKTLMAILNSIQFSPPPPPVVAGSVVWQKTGPLGEADSPQDFLVALAVGPDDSIYTADSASIFVFDAAGNGPRILQNAAVTGIRDLAIAPDGQLWVVSGASNQVLLLDADGGVVKTWGEVGQDAGQFGFLSPLQIEIGPDGNLYLLDNNVDANGQPLGQIQVWSTAGEFLRAFPLDGRGETSLGYAEMRIAFGPDGLLYVLDANVLRAFDTNGTLVADNIATGRLSEPDNLGITLAVDGAGFIYVATAGGNILQQDATGEYVQQFGTLQAYPNDATGDPAFVPGEFAHPEGLGVLSNGDLVVADANFDYWQVVRFTFAAE